MKLDGKQSFIHNAQRKMRSESDIPDKFKIIKILREEFGLFGLTGEAIQINEYKCRWPDVLVKANIPMIAIELQGHIHGYGEPISESQRDVQRNTDYQFRTDIKLIKLGINQTNGY